MSAASDFLRKLGKPQLDADEMRHFIACLSADTEKESRQSAVDCLLRVSDLSPDQVVLLGACEPVARSVGLQLSVRRYATSKQFEAARESSANEPAWQRAVMILAASIPS